MSQHQKGGSNSTNIQVGTVSVGLSYKDVRDIATDLFQENFAHLAAEAKDTVEKRVAEMRDEFIERLEKDTQANPQAFSQVEKQIMLLEAQKGFAISGDDELKKLLISTIINASTAPERSKKSIVLGEAIKIAPLLMKNQIKILEIIFFIAYKFVSANDIHELFNEYLNVLDLTEKNIELSDGDLRHMEYLSCGTNGIGMASFYQILVHNSPGLLCKGFSQQELQSAFLPESLPTNALRASPRTPNAWEIAAQNVNIIDQAPWTAHQKQIAKEKIKQRLIDHPTLMAELEKNSQRSGYLYKMWENSDISHFHLTSVGIAIAYTSLSERVSFPELDVFL